MNSNNNLIYYIKYRYALWRFDFLFDFRNRRIILKKEKNHKKKAILSTSMR